MSNALFKTLLAAIVMIGMSDAAHSEPSVLISRDLVEIRELLMKSRREIIRCCLRPCWPRTVSRVPDHMHKGLRDALRQPLN